MQGRTLSEIRTEEALRAAERERDEAERKLRRIRALLCARIDESAEDAAARLVRERDYWRQQMELAGPELDRLRGNCPACGRSVDVSGRCWPECHSTDLEELRELAWRWCIEARVREAVLRLRERMGGKS